MLLEGLAEFPMSFHPRPNRSSQSTYSGDERAATPGAGTEGLRSDSCLKSCECGCLGGVHREDRESPVGEL